MKPDLFRQKEAVKHGPRLAKNKHNHEGAQKTRLIIFVEGSDAVRLGGRDDDLVGGP